MAAGNSTSTPVTVTAPSMVTLGKPATLTDNGASSAVVTVMTSGNSTETNPSIVTLGTPVTLTDNGVPSGVVTFIKSGK